MSVEFLGLRLVEEKEVRCSKCNKVLLNVIVTETNHDRQKRGLKPQSSKFKVNKCYNCGGQSFWTKVFEGSTNLGQPSDFVNFSPESTEINDDGVIETILSTDRSK
jgi:hypothetical protein